jgi:DNA-binding NarL/FixJ family response regulator
MLIADDHKAARKVVCSILASREDLGVCGEASNRQEAVQKAIELNPDLIILDIAMPVLGGLAATIQLKEILPDVPILILSIHDGLDLVLAVRSAGAQGYVSKSEAGRALLNAVDALLQGQTFFPKMAAPENGSGGVFV